MTTTDGSAKIYVFPARGRFAAQTMRDETRPTTSMMPSRMARVASGGAWYHEEAIREADLSREP